MALENLKVWCSPLTSTIYAGYINKDGRTVKSKIDVTQQVIDAVMQHMDVTKEEYECEAGELIFKPKAIESTEQPSTEGAEAV